MYSEKFLQEKREDILSDYIDDLNKDKKPNYEEILSFEENEELIEILETVCAVKRLRKEETEENLQIIKSSNIKEKKKEYKKMSFIRKMVATAAMAAVLLGGGIIYQNTNNAKTAKNIAYATMKQYNNIHNFKGVLKETLVDKNSVTTHETTIQYIEPNKFYAVSEGEAGTTKKLYKGGDTLYEYDRNGNLTMRTITEDSLQFELSTYRADRKMKEIVENMKNVKPAGEDMVAGRATQVYEFYYEEKGIQHKIWIDKELGIALKEVFQDEKGLTIVSEFVEFDSDIKIQLPEVTEMDKAEAKDERLTEEQKAKDKELKNLVSQFKEGQILEVQFMGLADSNSAEFKVGENYFNFGITEKLKEKFSTISSGKKLKVAIGFEGWTTNPIIKEIK